MSKLAIVVDHFLPRIGGIELQVHDLAFALSKHFEKIDIITTTPIAKEITIASNIQIIRIKTPLLPKLTVAFTPHMIPKIKSILLKNQYDMVHLHCSVVSPMVFTAFIYLNRWKRPHVMTAHSLHETSGWWYSYLKHLSPSLKQVTTLFCGVSNKVNDGLKAVFSQGHFGLLPNAITLSQWKTTPQQDMTIRVVSVLRFTKKKRLHGLLNIIPAIIAKLAPEIVAKVQFTIVGDGPYRPQLEAIVKKNKISQWVQFTGIKKRSEIKEIFAKSQIFVLPTLKEAFGIALLEARAAGLPCVAMNYGGTSDIIKHRENGLLASNDQELANMIASLINDETLRQKLAQNNLVDQFDWQYSIARHLACYAQAKDLCAKFA